MSLRCIIVDDEPPAHLLLENYIGQTSILSLVGHAYSATECLSVLKKEQPDVVFLDIHMPGLSGIEMLKLLDSKPQTIITTAYGEFALDGFDLGVVDFLVKPIRYDRFLKAVQRLNFSAANLNPADPAVNVEVATSILIKDKGLKKEIPFENITYIESAGNYIKIHTVNDTVFIVSTTMKKIEMQLPVVDFIRVHKSFIINKALVAAFFNQKLQVAGKMIPVGESYKQAVYKALGN